MSAVLKLAAHPIAEVFPRMTAYEFKALRDDIKEHGLREPIWLYEEKVLDGRHRWDACEELEIKPQTREYDGGDPIAFVVSVNLKRRHLSNGQRSMVAAKIANLPRGANQHASTEASSQKDAAKQLDVSRSSVQRAKKIQENGTPELVAAVESGKVSVSAAAEVAKRPKAKQAKALAEPKKAKPPKPDTADWKAKYDTLAADYDELKENRDDLADELKTCEAIRGGEAALEIQKLRFELKTCTRRRDELMAAAVEMRKQCKWWEAQARKLGYKAKEK